MKHDHRVLNNREVCGEHTEKAATGPTARTSHVRVGGSEKMLCRQANRVDVRREHMIFTLPGEDKAPGKSRNTQNGRRRPTAHGTERDRVRVRTPEHASSATTGRWPPTRPHTPSRPHVHIARHLDLCDAFHGNPNALKRRAIDRFHAEGAELQAQTIDALHARDEYRRPANLDLAVSPATNDHGGVGPARHNVAHPGEGGRAGATAGAHGRLRGNTETIIAGPVPSTTRAG